MKVIKKMNQKVIKSKTCGDLVQVLENKEAPISVVVSKDLKPTKGHLHKRSHEFYYVVSGFLTIDITLENGKKKRVVLGEGELIAIDPNEFHEVVQASDKNEVIVICDPPWTSEDQYLL